MLRDPKNIPDNIRQTYEVIEWNHASAILNQDFPSEWKDLIAVLSGFKLLQSFIDADGGRKSPISEAIDKAFALRGWGPKKFDTQITVDENSHDTPTHEVDNFKNGIAVETEWNNKDPFFDRDLNNFRLLHQLGVISVGVIITRSDELAEVFKLMGKAGSYGQSTTHMSKLIPRLEGGGAGGCPVLVFGIGMGLYKEDLDPQVLAERVTMRSKRKADAKDRKRIILEE
jgi:Restriction endonuclease BglII